jgi:hypothetical protein
MSIITFVRLYYFHWPSPMIIIWITDGNIVVFVVTHDGDYFVGDLGGFVYFEWDFWVGLEEEGGAMSHGVDGYLSV